MPYGIDEQRLRRLVLAALKAWHSVGGSSDDLLEELRLVRQARQADHQIKRHLVVNTVLLSKINQLGQQNNQLADLLRHRFIDQLPARNIAQQNKESLDWVNRTQSQAVDELTHIIFVNEVTLREEMADDLESLLPLAQYSKLFGFQDAVRIIQKKIEEDRGSWVTAIVGMGGMGKTALSDFVTRRLIRAFIFENVLWIRVASSIVNNRLQSPELTYENLIAEIAYQLWPNSAHSLTDQNRFKRVKQTLKERPYLVVIDNLEAITDAAYMFDYFNDLANPSKFLLTTRIQPPQQSNVFGYRLKGLTFEQATDFMQFNAKDRGVVLFNEATEEEFNAIFAATGGNPLALRLVVSLLETYPLPTILNNLRLSVDEGVSDLYQRIFQQAWAALSSNARKLLKVMPLVSQSGATPDYLSTILGIPQSEIWPLIFELSSRSLLESRGNLSERRYGVHQLTNTFLHSEVINWETQAWQI